MSRGSLLGVVREVGPKYQVGTIVFQKGYQTLDGNFYSMNGTWIKQYEAADYRDNPNIKTYPNK